MDVQESKCSISDTHARLITQVDAGASKTAMMYWIATRPEPDEEMKGILAREEAAAAQQEVMDELTRTVWPNHSTYAPALGYCYRDAWLSARPRVIKGFL